MGGISDVNVVQAGGCVATVAVVGGVVIEEASIGKWILNRYNSFRYSNNVYRPSSGQQANYINQHAAFKEHIPHGDGLSINLEGMASVDGTQHNKIHQVMDDFFENYQKPNGKKTGEKWKVEDYNKAVKKALKAAGLSNKQVVQVYLLVKLEQKKFNVPKTLDKVPRRATRRC
ncbi:hypothetical protein [Gimesia sp.]|uniref:hypothetical protein n=1 Tax=Gimesia sp. TaxID=2024833 RepID=UPI003A93B5F1